MELLVILVFVAGYLAIALEHPIRVNKTASALLTGVLCWTIYSFTGHAGLDQELAHHLSKISEILFFLLGAMTIVELVDAYQGFRIITDRIQTRNPVVLLWIICTVTFFLSSVLDNLTTSIVMVSLIRKLIPNKDMRMFFGGMIVIAANAGGAWTPIGDVTTTMLWIGGQISTVNIMTSLFIPSVVSVLVPLIFLTFTMKGDLGMPDAGKGEAEAPPTGSRTMLMLGIGALIFVPVFKTVTHLPPYLGMLLGLGVLWVVSEMINPEADEAARKPLSAAGALSRIDSSSVLFFLGILLAVSALESMSILGAFASWLDTTLGSQSLIITLIGLLSAIIDNVPLVAASMGMYSLADYPMDSMIWEYLAYCAGTGGSILIIGSAAGVAVMGMEKIDFIWYLRRISAIALIGYFAGAFTYLGISSLNPEATAETRLELFKRIDQEISLNSKAYATLQEETSTIGHRLTGSENGSKAEQYTFDKFKEYGFEDVRFQEFEVESWSRGSIDVAIAGDPVKAVTLGHSPQSADVTAEVVDFGNGLAEDFEAKPDAAKGKIALFHIGILEGSKPGLVNLHRSEKTALAIKAGAAGVIIFNSVDNGVLLTGTASVTGDVIPIPAICIGKEDGFTLKEKLKTGKVSARIRMTNNRGPIRARNVIATIKGSEKPDERIIVGGHLDSWDLATGAIDNGIGSFAVLDMARAFKANNLKPKRTVQFVMFMGEEQGLLGSRHMVSEAVKDGSIKSIKYMLNFDMTGNPIGISAGGMVTDTVFFKKLGEEIAQVDTIYQNKFSRGGGLHSDNQPFMLEGVPVLGMHSNLDRSIYRCYHADCDDFSLVDETHIRNTARFGSMVLYAIADATKLPAARMNSEQTRQFLIDNGLKEPLVIAGDWKWKD